MSEPIHQLPVERMRRIMQKVMHEDMLTRHDAFEQRHNSNWVNWKERERYWERRQRWIYGFVTATVLALIGWLVAGGCR